MGIKEEEYEYVDPFETISILGETIEHVVFNENLALVEIYEGPNSGYYIVEKIKGQDKPSTSEIKATPSTSNVMVNGSRVDFDAYLIEGNNYFKLRDLAKLFDIGITYDGSTQTVGIDANIGYVEE